MKEHIDTIPLHEAFESGDECPFCYLERLSEQRAIRYCIGPGASYMEPDFRGETDRLGFCRQHLKKLYDYGNTLGNALMLQTYYAGILEEDVMHNLYCPWNDYEALEEIFHNHPGEIAALCDIARPDVGVVTNVGTAHMEFFGSREGIAREKGELLKRSKIAFSAKDADYLAGEVDTKAQWLEELMASGLPGSHNVANAALAYAAASHFGLSPAGAAEALKDFSLPGARWRKLEKWGATFIDDSYNASPDSMIAALDAFAATSPASRHIAVLGDMLELGEDSAEYHRRVFAHAMSKKFHLVIGVGEQSSKCICNLAYRRLKDLKKKFRVDVSAGDVVLLKASHSIGLGELLQ
jgi:UDP-N-acetylmuramyl pentapeptide synthase